MWVFPKTNHPLPLHTHRLYYTLVTTSLFRAYHTLLQKHTGVKTQILGNKEVTEESHLLPFCQQTMHERLRGKHLHPELTSLTFFSFPLRH